MKDSSLKLQDNSFFTSDLHFCHGNIISHCNRPFSDIDEMTEGLIQNWNSVVQQSSTVYVLGDMFWKPSLRETYTSIMSRLNGRKYLVVGNHDFFSRESYLAMGFEDVFDILTLSTKIDGKRQEIVCCHYPLLEWNGFYQGSWHLHGHTHGLGSHFSHRVMDAGVDTNSYFPVSWPVIVQRLSGGFEKDLEDMEKRQDTQTHRPYRFR